MKALAALTLACALFSCRRTHREPPAGSVEWNAEHLPRANARLTAVAGTAADDVWAVGEGIFHFGGKHWTEATPNGLQSRIEAIAVVARDDVWAVGVAGHLLHFDGERWHDEQLAVARVSKNGNGYFDLLDVAAWRNEVWVTDSHKGYYRFDGKSWSDVVVPERQFQQVFGVAPNDVWSVAARMAHWDGERWDLSTVLPIGVRRAHGIRRDDVWAVGWKGNPKDAVGAAAHFDGSKWTVSTLPAGAPVLWTVHAASATEAYAVGHDGWIVAWDGHAWRSSNSGTRALLRGVYAAGSGEAFAVGDLDGKVLHKKP